MRKVFFSFNWEDVRQANQIRNVLLAKGGFSDAGIVDEAEVNQLEGGTEQEIKDWIKSQLQRSSITCVLIGKNTDKSTWVKYEIEKSLRQGNGVIGVLIYGLDNNKGELSSNVAAPLVNYGENDFGKNIKNALMSEGSGYGLARLVFPQLAVPATLVGLAFASLKPNDDYKIYDWLEDKGYENFDDWIEKAARQVGR